MQLENNNNRRSVKRRRNRFILLGIGLFLITVTLFGFWFWSSHKNVIIENEIGKAIVNTNKEGLYKISYEDMIVDESAGNLSVTNMRVIYDSAKYLLKEQKGETPPMLFDIDIPEINLVGVKTKRALLDKEIVGRKIEIKNPVVNLHYTYRGEDSEKNVPTEEVYKEVLANLGIIQFDSVLISNAQIITRHLNTGKTIIDVKNIDLSLLDLKIDSAAFTDSSRFLFAKNMNINLAEIGWSSSNQLYKYKANDLKLNSEDKSLAIGQVSIIPRLGENEFVNAIPTQDDRFSFSFKNIFFSGLNIQRLFDEYLSAQTMTIGNSSLKVYRDLARPRDKENRVGKYPHQVLDDIPFRFNIRKIHVHNSFVEYKERNHITRQSGKVQFYNVNGTITNFTNDKKAPGKVMRAVLSSDFLNKTPLTTDWTFYLFHPKGNFTVSGTAGTIDGKLLNVLAEPMGPAKIEEGNMKGLSFDLYGNDYSMNGTVKMLYDDLKVTLLEKDKGAIETDKKFLTTLLANFVIKDSNPKGDDDVRTQQVRMTRNVNRSMFNLCWKTLFTGIRKTLGINRELTVK